MSTIAGYADLMNYRNLPAGGTAPQAGSSVNAETERSSDAPRRNPDSAGDKPDAGRQAGAAEPDTRGMLESIKRAGSRLSDDDLQDTLDDMVLSGDITGDQADEIFAGLKGARGSAPAAVMKSLNGLAESGALSREQRDAAAAALSGAGDGLQELVSEGTLTQDQMDAVLESCRSAMKLRQARQAYSLMQHNPLARAAASRQYGILDAYEDSMAEGVSG